jgi:hypothetical protein
MLAFVIELVSAVLTELGYAEAVASVEQKIRERWAGVRGRGASGEWGDTRELGPFYAPEAEDEYRCDFDIDDMQDLDDGSPYIWNRRD